MELRRALFSADSKSTSFISDEIFMSFSSSQAVLFTLSCENDWERLEQSDICRDLSSGEMTLLFIPPDGGRAGKVVPGKGCNESVGAPIEFWGGCKGNQGGQNFRGGL